MYIKVQCSFIYNGPNLGTTKCPSTRWWKNTVWHIYPCSNNKEWKNTDFGKSEPPVGLLSMGSHRVGHDWRDLAAAAAEPPWFKPWLLCLLAELLWTDFLICIMRVITTQQSCYCFCFCWIKWVSIQESFGQDQMPNTCSFPFPFESVRSHEWTYLR